MMPDYEKQLIRLLQPHKLYDYESPWFQYSIVVLKNIEFRVET